ncbi:hypothetical protein [Streptomyces sioyaensis]
MIPMLGLCAGVLLLLVLFVAMALADLFREWSEGEGRRRGE